MFYKNDLKSKSQVRYYGLQSLSHYPSLSVTVCEIAIPCCKRVANRFFRWLYSELFTALKNSHGRLTAYIGALRGGGIRGPAISGRVYIPCLLYSVVLPFVQ